MDKWMKYLVLAMTIVAIASLNLSSSCVSPSIAATDIASVAHYRKGISANEVFDADFSLPYATHQAGAAAVDANTEGAVEAPAEELTWRTLTDVEFKDVYVEELDAYYWKPTFGESVKALKGKEVYITGYIIPVDYDEDFYVLSRYPFANCFFCGGAGPESVVDLRFKSKTRKYETDERLTFKGTFALNADDVYQMNYILEGAVEYKP